ncbi:unnamed protein product [Ectocarpus sp. 8 AP-2014]
MRSGSRVYPSTWKEAPSCEFVCVTRRIRLLYLSVLMRHHAWHNIDAYVSWLYDFIGRGRRSAFCVVLFLWDLRRLFSLLRIADCEVPLSPRRGQSKAKQEFRQNNLLRGQWRVQK